MHGSFDIYHRKTDGALAPAPIALEFGIGTFYSNILDLTHGFVFYRLHHETDGIHVFDSGSAAW